MLFVRRGKDRREYFRISKGFNEAWRKAGRSKLNCFIRKQYYPFFSENEKETLSRASLFRAQRLVIVLHASEAIAAVNRTIGLGLERNASLAAAGSAGSGEVLTGTASSILASVTAGLAALGLILEAALCVELLLTGGENEFLATLFAD